METDSNEEKLTFGVKLRTARKSAGLTQSQLAEKLMVSRQAVTKWEADKGLPDIENLKVLSKLLDVSIEYLLDNGEQFNFTVIREEINLENYSYKRRLRRRWNEETGKKDMIVKEKFPNADIHYLLGNQILTSEEKITDNVLGFLFGALFGIPKFLNALKNKDKEFYLVNQSDKQFLAVVTDEYIESRQLSEFITAKNFIIGDFKFMDCGEI